MLIKRMTEEMAVCLAIENVGAQGRDGYVVLRSEDHVSVQMMGKILYRNDWRIVVKTTQTVTI